MLKIAVVFAFVAISCVYADDAGVYLFDPLGKSGVTGNVTFTKANNAILIKGTVAGLTPGLHGFHIHKLGHITPGCLGTGPHFNPLNKKHGAPSDEERHVGDLGNIVANDNGVAEIDFSDKVIQLEGENCIIGRAVVVHEKEDDLGKGGHPDSLTTGNAGGRVACGVIGILEPTNSQASTILTFIPIITILMATLATFV